jgi:hypothetical protein
VRPSKIPIVPQLVLVCPRPLDDEPERPPRKSVIVDQRERRDLDPRNASRVGGVKVRWRVISVVRRDDDLVELRYAGHTRGLCPRARRTGFESSRQSGKEARKN